MQSVDQGIALLNRHGLDPVYVVHNTDQFCQLSDKERRMVFGTMTDDTKAFTCPVADLMFRSGYLRYQWRGRGCCIVFRQSPLTMTAVEVEGLMHHEAGHWIADCDKPERDDTDAGRAVATWWKSMTNGVEHHGERWLRATVHLWHRSCKLGHEIPLSSVVRLEQYGFDRSHLAPLLDEAERREGEPIESILGTGPAPHSKVPVRAQKKSLGLPNNWMANVAGRLIELGGGYARIDGRDVGLADIVPFYRHYTYGEPLYL